MHLYDVANSNRTGMFIVAEDEFQAKKIALLRGHIRTPHAARVKDVTNEMLVNDKRYPNAYASLTTILKDNKQGQVVKRLAVYSASDIAHGSVNKDHEVRWELLPQD